MIKLNAVLEYFTFLFTVCFHITLESFGVLNPLQAFMVLMLLWSRRCSYERYIITVKL